MRDAYEEMKLQSMISTYEPWMLISFDDPCGYGGKVPTEQYLATVYKQHGLERRPPQDAEIKKGDTEIASIDAHFKVPKKICHYKGASVVQSLITMKDNVSDEIRTMFLASSDAHDQYEAPFAEMKKTNELYGHKGPKLVYCDNPSSFLKFCRESFPRVREKNQKLKEIAEKLNEWRRLNATDDEAKDPGKYVKKIATLMPSESECKVAVSEEDDQCIV